MIDREPTPETKKELWLGELTGFLVESYANGWASGAKKEKDPVTGEKKLVYERDDWRYEDGYSGYFAAPGESKVFYKGKHVWSMNYAGPGQNPEHYDEVQETFAFLKEALMLYEKDLPLRGPAAYHDQSGEWRYDFYLIEGNIENAVWREEINRWVGYPGDTPVYFTQLGTCGIIIDKDDDFQPVYPWDI